MILQRMKQTVTPKATAKPNLNPKKSELLAAKVVEVPKFEIKIFIPKNQIVLAAPEMAIYDEKFQCWRSQGITNVKFDENLRSITFTTEKLGKFAALQDKKLDLPYQEWTLTNNEKGSCFNLNANYTELTLLISDNDNSISVNKQVHEEVSGMSLVLDEEKELREKLEAGNSKANVYSQSN